MVDKVEGDRFVKESGMFIMGGLFGMKKFLVSVKGNIYYMNFYIVYYNYGYVGMYLFVDKIVEFVLSDGVRQIVYNVRDVEDNFIV